MPRDVRRRQVFELAAPPDLVTTYVNLENLRVPWTELAIGRVRPEH